MSSTRPGPWSFDAGALAGALARAGRLEQDPPFLGRPLRPYDEEGAVIRLADLCRFLDHPVKAFMSRRLQVHLPGDDHDVSDDLVTSLGALEAWGTAERLIRARPGDRSSSQWRRHERALGAASPRRARGALSGRGRGDGGLSVVFGGRPRRRRLAPRAAPGRPRARRRNPHRRRSDRTAGRALGRTGTRHIQQGPPQTACPRLARARGPHRDGPRDDLAKRRGGTRRGLNQAQVARTCRVRSNSRRSSRECAQRARGRRRLLPPRPARAHTAVRCFSRKLYKGKAKADDWDSERGHGTRKDEANRIAFGRFDFTQLLALTAREDDPPGDATGRALRFASYLWGTIESTAVEPT